MRNTQRPLAHGSALSRLARGLTVLSLVSMSHVVVALAPTADWDGSEPAALDTEFEQPDTGPIAVQVAGLKDQLEKGLRARRPVEFVFIGQVVALVESDDLPLKLVLETFQWARHKDRHFPFPYFERALRVRAARIGVTIP